MIYKLGYIKDIMGNNYIGLKFRKNQMQPYLNELKNIVDDDKYETLVFNQQKRDLKDNSEYTHHSTVISVMEYNKIYEKLGSKFQEKINFLLSLDITDLDMLGVGKAKKAENETYYVVLGSATLNEIRTSLGLEPKDFHVTLGFDKKDVFGVRKNQVLHYDTKLEKIYKQKMLEYNSHEWIYDIINFNENLKKIPTDKIELVKVTDSLITYKLDHTLVQITLLNDELYVVTESEIK